MALPEAPFELELISQKLIKPTGIRHESTRTELSCCDCITVLTATARAWAFQGAARISAPALESALSALLADLPFLAGRLGRMQGWRLGSLYIDHNGAGALLTVVEAEGVSVASTGPDSWVQRGMTLADPAVPFYIERMDTGKKLLSGQEPLMKVRLSRLADGDILAITLCHVCTDGMRWPQLAAHLAARYRQAAGGGGTPLDRSALLHPTDRRQLSSAGMAAQLLGEDQAWQPAQELQVRSSLKGMWRLAKLLVSDARQEVDLVMLHLPQDQVARLKQLAAGGSSQAPITTGDAVQAACALLLHSVLGRPLLPVAPSAMVALVQLPTPAGYLGNAVHMLPVRLPAGTTQPAEGDSAGALQRLAAAIRQATATFRAEPDLALQALYDTETLAAAPAYRMLSFLAAKRMHRLTCTTNFVPRQQGIDLGLGQPATYIQGMTMPRARDMALIRPAQPPYSPGLFVQMCITPQQAAQLRTLPLLAQLVPGARWVGELDAYCRSSCSVAGSCREAHSTA